VAGIALADADFALLMGPPRRTEALPGIGGRLRARPEDFVVRELPAYDADGREGHLLLTLRKRLMTTDEAIAAVAEACGIDRREIGVAGLKDRDAVTEQRISAPAEAADALARFRHPQIELGAPAPHSHKLRRGHLHGNAFEVTIRDLAVALADAEARASAKLDALAAVGGLDNLYGIQRFGHDGRNIHRGLERLAGGARGRRKADFLTSAGQSALFNLYLLERRARGLSRTVLLGDVLKKTATGGLFVCDDPETDQARLDADELVITGPIFGGKMKAPPPGSPSADLEREILDRVGVDPNALIALGKKTPGTRRPLQLTPGELQLRRVPAVELASQGMPPHKATQHGEGLCLSFRLPSGAYATQLTHEIQGPTDDDTSTHAPVSHQGP
jgi:tRNA pseudouridine13 synthase